MFAITGKSPQNPPTATSPDPRLMALGAAYGFGAIMIKSKIRKLVTSAIVTKAVKDLVTIILRALIVAANKSLNTTP